MGQTLSKFNSNAIDGLGYNTIAESRPTKQSFEKLQQLLRCIVNYEPDKLAPVLVSLYFLGLTPKLLTVAFDTLAEPLKAWPDEDPIADSIGDESLGDYFGLYEYQRRYFEFFRDQLTEYANWHDLLHIYVPLLGTKLLGSDSAPLNQLAVAVEVDDPVLAMHALAYAASTDKLFRGTGTVEVTLHQLVDMCLGTPHIVTAQSFCELMLSKKCKAEDFEPIMIAFAKSVADPAENPNVKLRNFKEEYDRLEQNLHFAPELRAEIFAQDFNKKQLFM